MFGSSRKHTARPKRGRRLKLFGRFTRQEEGSAAVEFALVAIPFLGMMFAIVETALVFFAGQALETAAADSARKVMTGQAEGWSKDRFKQEVCGRIYGLFDCNKILVNVRAYPTFSAADMRAPVNASGNIVDEFNAGAPGDVIIARLIYEWPIHIPLLQLDDRPGGKRMLMATVAFRNEPYR